MATAFLSVAACAIAAPLNPACGAEELDSHLEALGVSAAVADVAAGAVALEVARCRGIPVVEPRRAPIAKPPRFSGAGDVALVLHTSGTTAKPRTVPLTHANLRHSARNVVRSLDLTAVDRCLNGKQGSRPVIDLKGESRAPGRCQSVRTAPLFRIGRSEVMSVRSYTPPWPR